MKENKKFAERAFDYLRKNSLMSLDDEDVQNVSAGLMSPTEFFKKKAKDVRNSARDFTHPKSGREVVKRIEKVNNYINVADVIVSLLLSSESIDFKQLSSEEQLQDHLQTIGSFLED